MVTTYAGWVADGRPWRNCQPINDLIATLRGHGYTGPGVGIGDQSHLTANPPEDHCPYSHTPWPGAQPYPYVMAIDIMPGEGIDIIDLGGRLFDDKSSDKPGTQPIKYINWTDSAGGCWHDSWMPSHTRFRSTDRGHIHISFRTDYVTSNAMASYDPYGDGGLPKPPFPEDDMANIPQDQWDAEIWRTEALIHDRPSVAGGPYSGEPNEMHAHLAAIDATLAEIKAALAAIQPGGIAAHTHEGGTSGPVAQG